MNTHDDNEQSPTLSLVCGRHGAQKLVAHIRASMSLLLKCGCIYSMERIVESDYEGNVFDGDTTYNFENLDGLVDDLIKDL